MAQCTMALVGLSHFFSTSKVLTSLVSLLPLSQFPPVFPIQLPLSFVFNSHRQHFPIHLYLAV